MPFLQEYCYAYVALCGWAAKADDSFVCFGAKPDKGFCQSRRFICLFWRETRQRILGPEISPYPGVGRGREKRVGDWEAVGAGQERGS